jgi:transposase-like protein
MSNPFRYFNSSPEVIRLVVMMYVRYPLSLRNVEGHCHIQQVKAVSPPWTDPLRYWNR